MKRKNEIIIILLNLIVILIGIKTNLFGSTMDFFNQHIVFPEYLRNTFYETGKIIPSTVTIGGVENIYNIAYYGLLNPIILLSYLLPFIKMIDYIVVTNIILLLASNALFYNFIKDKFNKQTTFITTLLFALSGPLIFQFHRHFMFVNYIPFLILSLISIDKDKKISLIINIFLIIMTSFYFSIPSIIAIVIYYLYKNKEIKDLIYILLIPILMSSLLTLPTLSAILSSRVSDSREIIPLLVPNINLDNILYGAYCPGLTSILIISLVYLIQTKDRKNIFLVISISILAFIPIILALLNGGLYDRPKVLIPLLPLLVYIIGIFINDLFENRIDVKKLIVFIFLFNLVVLIRYHVVIYYLDLIFMIFLILMYNKTKNKFVLSIPLALLNLIICILLNSSETFISRNLYNSVNKDINIDTVYRIANLNYSNYTVNKYNFTPSIYSSTINKYYSNLYHNIFKVNNDSINNLELTSTSNVLFNEYLGVKYVVSDFKLNQPYKNINNNVYELSQALPIGYVNSNTVNKDYFNSLEYPYNLEIFMNYIIDENSKNTPISNIEEVNLNYTFELGENIVFMDDKIYVNSDDSIIVNITDNMDDKILFINMYDQIEQDNDIAITINGQTNLLTKKGWLYPNHNNTFYFCVEGTNSLKIELKKGIYNVKNIKTYILDNKYISSINNTIDKYDIINMDSEGIKGSINSSNDGYFVLSIPFDKGFDIKVNGNSVEYKLINDSFIGFYLDKGDYDVEVTYDPPLLREGKIFSILGFILLGIVIKEREKI